MTALFTFAHRALAPQLHADPPRFVATLDGSMAPRSFAPDDAAGFQQCIVAILRGEGPRA